MKTVDRFPETAWFCETCQKPFCARAKEDLRCHYCNQQPKDGFTAFGPEHIEILLLDLEKKFYGTVDNALIEFAKTFVRVKHKFQGDPYVW